MHGAMACGAPLKIPLSDVQWCWGHSRTRPKTPQMQHKSIGRRRNSNPLPSNAALPWQWAPDSPSELHLRRNATHTGDEALPESHVFKRLRGRTALGLPYAARCVRPLGERTNACRTASSFVDRSVAPPLECHRHREDTESFERSYICNTGCGFEPDSQSPRLSQGLADGPQYAQAPWLTPSPIAKPSLPRTTDRWYKMETKARQLI